MNRPSEKAKDWNKITIHITGNDIIFAPHYFGKSTAVNETSNLEEFVETNEQELTAEQIGFVNSNEGLRITEGNLDENTEY